MSIFNTETTCAIAGFSRRTLYRLMKKNEFPQPIQRGKGKKKPQLYFCEQQVVEWAKKNNPQISSAKLVRKIDIADEMCVSTVFVKSCTKISGFPQAILVRSNSHYYNFSEVMKWFSENKPNAFKRMLKKKVNLKPISAQQDECINRSQSC